jgi:hypothetical protein
MSLDGEVDQFAIGGQEFALDEIVFKGDGRIEIPVDDSSDELVVSVAWQHDTGGSHQTRLFDPDDNPVPLGLLQKSPRGTNDVWRVPAPSPGIYRLAVENLPQEFFVTGSAVSRYELETYVGTEFEARQQGTPIPIVASFTGNAKPLLDADVQATVTAPDGHRQTLHLYDDGNHGDGEPNDGLYGNHYLATSLAGIPAPPPDMVVDGAEPEAVGSYIVNTVANKDDIRREAEDSFVIRRAPDSDGDGLPDDYEIANGLDPRDPVDGRLDEDMDGLSALCEYQAGTNPFNSDTDGGGESDGTEVVRDQQRRCRAGSQDPNDPSDDRVRPLSSIIAHAETTTNGTPYIDVHISSPQRPTKIELMRQAIGPEGRPVEQWRTIAELTKDELEFEDRQVREGIRYQYKAMPQFDLAAQKSIVEFESLEKGQVLKVGDRFAEAGIRVTATPFYPSTARPFTDGQATIGDALALGTGQDASLNNINLRFDFPQQLSAASLFFNASGGTVNLIVNGHRRIVRDLLSLHGESIDDVQITVNPLRGGFELELQGAIDSLEIGGQELVIDHVVACVGHDVTVAGRNLLTPFVAATTDPYAPDGTVLINGGDLTTTSREVMLQLTATDDERESHIDDGERVQGTPTAKLLMRISNDPDFEDTRWIPFASMTPWTLDESVAPGGSASVFVQFQDQAGNISHGLISDSIIYEPATMAGDVNLDGKLDALDINLLCAAIQGQATPGNGDLNGDQQINFDDVVYLVTTLLETTFGDANLDKIFNSSDLIQVFVAGQYEDAVPQNSTWATGDWDCNGEFGTSDLILAFQYGGYSTAATPNRELSAAGRSPAGSEVRLPVRHADTMLSEDEIASSRRKRSSATDRVFATYDEPYRA